MENNDIRLNEGNKWKINVTQSAMAKSKITDKIYINLHINGIYSLYIHDIYTIHLCTVIMLKFNINWAKIFYLFFNYFHSLKKILFLTRIKSRHFQTQNLQRIPC